MQPSVCCVDHMNPRPEADSEIAGFVNRKRPFNTTCSSVRRAPYVLHQVVLTSIVIVMAAAMGAERL